MTVHSKFIAPRACFKSEYVWDVLYYNRQKDTVAFFGQFLITVWMSTTGACRTRCTYSARARLSTAAAIGNARVTHVHHALSCITVTCLSMPSHVTVACFSMPLHVTVHASPCRYTSSSHAFPSRHTSPSYSSPCRHTSPSHVPLLADRSRTPKP